VRFGAYLHARHALLVVISATYTEWRTWCDVKATCEIDRTELGAQPS
jgi:hypothetical protein